MTKLTPDGLHNVSETLLLTLNARAIESRRADGLLRDDTAVSLVKKLDYDFDHIRMQDHDQLFVILRVRKFDEYVKRFLAKNPDGVVFHIGCGLDTRFERVDNGNVEWFDLDLPEVINLRKSLMDICPDPRYHLEMGSVLDYEWQNLAKIRGNRSILFMAEGVFPYFEAKQVRNLILALSENFPGAELVIDAHTSYTTMADNVQLFLAGISARMNWRLNEPESLETWKPGIKLLDKWYYFDDPEPRLKLHRWMKIIPGLSKSSGIFHYKLGEKIS